MGVVVSIEKRFATKYRVAPDGCWEWIGARAQTNGTSAPTYGIIWRDGHFVYAHRVSFELHLGPIPAGLMVRHRCDKQRCVNPAHLELGTAAENVGDMIARGKAPRPPRNTKLSDEDVVTIRERFAGGVRQYLLARAFKVSPATICMIVNGQHRATT